MFDHMISKSRLVHYVDDLLQERLKVLQEQISSVTKTANEETKSSMGDKYETGRAMAHLELEKLHRQQAEIQKNNLILKEAERLNGTGSVQLGSIVFTTAGTYFLACGLGKIVIDDNVVFVISLSSAIGQSLRGKRKGDRFLFNQKEATILDLGI